MRVDPNELRSAATELQDIAADLIDDVRTLFTEAESLMTSHWTGSAAESHRAQWSGWSEAARRLVCALAQDAYLLNRVAVEFVESDSAFAQAVA